LEELIPALRKLFLSLEGLDVKTDSTYVLAFVVACWIMGVASLILDLCYLHSTGKSFLKLRHGLFNTLGFLVTWPLGAMIFGYFALIVHILQPSVLGAATAGITWIVLIRSLIGRLDRPKEEEEDKTDGEET